MAFFMSMLGGPAPAPPPGRASDPRWGGYIARCGGGDQSALGALYDESSSLIYGVVNRILQNREDAEEVTLDVYTQVWRSAKDYSPERGSPATWLIMLARSRALDRARSRQRRPSGDAPLEELAELRSAEALPEETAVSGQQRRLVLQAMATLAPEQRLAIELSFFGGLSHSELAEKLGEPLGTVKTRIRLGMTKLRQLLGAGKELQ